MSYPTKRVIALVSILIGLLALAACSSTDHMTPTSDNTQAKPVSNAVPQTMEQCQSGDDHGQRSHDVAELVHDSAIANYLRYNVLDFGRLSTDTDEAYALMLLQDHDAYEMCVTAPEYCLRAHVRQAADQHEVLAILETKGDQAFETALECLQKAGDAYAAREPLPSVSAADPAQLNKAYQERMAHHLIGNMMPLDLLVSTEFFGPAGPEAIAIATATATATRDACYEQIIAEPLNPAELVARISRDTRNTLDCAQIPEIIPDSPNTNALTNPATTP